MTHSEAPQIIELDKPVNEGESLMFEFSDYAGLISEGFVLRHQGQLYAYRNLCRHQPRPLDFGDAVFLTDDKRYIMCVHHAAIFEPDTGLCVSGPCEGACLFHFPVTEEDGKITVTIPPQTIDLE